MRILINTSFHDSWFPSNNLIAQLNYQNFHHGFFLAGLSSARALCLKNILFVYRFMSVVVDYRQTLASVYWPHWIRNFIGYPVCLGVKFYPPNPFSPSLSHSSSHSPTHSLLLHSHNFQKWENVCARWNVQVNSHLQIQLFKSFQLSTYDFADADVPTITQLSVEKYQCKLFFIDRTPIYHTPYHLIFWHA